MDEIPIPFTDQNVDPDDRTGAVMTIVLVIVGFGIFAMASSIGDYLGSKANQVIGDVTGVNPATGSNSDPELI